MGEDTVLLLTLVGTVGAGLVAVVSAVVVAVAGPILRDAAATVTFELDAGAGVAAARLVTVIPTVIVCAQIHRFLDFTDIWTFVCRVKLSSSASLTIIAAPVDVDAAAIGTGELGQREAGRVG